MFRSFVSLSNKYGGTIKRYFVTRCEEQEEDTIIPSLVEQADAAVDSEREKIKTPIQYDNLRGTIMQGSVNSYDGFRLIVQKQVNLNTVVSHFYWIGSQATGQPIYQYRLILPFEERVVNVATDMDFNIEGEIKAPITKNILGKSNFVIGGEQKSFSLELDCSDDSSSTHFQYSGASENSLSMAYMQSITPSLTMGGSGLYSLKTSTLSTSFGGIYSRGENLLAIQWDKNLRLMYLRKVNPNRVHLSTDLLVDETGNTQMTLAAEYTLKQSKLHMSVDSNMLMKSLVETSLAPGVQMQLCAEVGHLSSQYRFGYGIIMG